MTNPWYTKKYVRRVTSLFIIGLMLSCVQAARAGGYDASQALPNIEKTVTEGATGITEGDITKVITTIVQGVLGMTGLLFFILMIYGGYIWMSSQGNEELVTKGKNTVIAAVIGIAIIVGGYAVTVFVAGALTK